MLPRNSLACCGRSIAPRSTNAKTAAVTDSPPVRPRRTLVSCASPVPGKAAQDSGPRRPHAGDGATFRANTSVSRGSPLLGGFVLVVAPYPQWRRGALVAALRRPVQQTVIGHRRFQAASGRYVGAVDGPVRARVHAEPRSLGDIPC